MKAIEGGGVAPRNDTPASLALGADQQAEVMRVVDAAGMRAEEFTWSVRPSSYHLIGPLVSALMHTPNGATLRFEFLESIHGMNRITFFTPKANAVEVRHAAVSWEHQLEHVREEA